MTDKSEVTLLLNRWRDGDQQALDELTPVVYGELHKLANAALRGERENHTLQPTAVIHEAYLQLVGASVEWRDSSHFYALAARMMRRILVNHANARNSAKRGGGRTLLTYTDSQMAGDTGNSEDVIELDAAIAALAREDRRKAEITELHYFGGMTYQQIGGAMSVSEATVKRELRFARAWLRREMKRDD